MGENYHMDTPTEVGSTAAAVNDDIWAAKISSPAYSGAILAGVKL